MKKNSKYLFAVAGLLAITALVLIGQAPASEALMNVDPATGKFDPTTEAAQDQAGRQEDKIFDSDLPDTEKEAMHGGLIQTMDEGNINPLNEAAEAVDRNAAAAAAQQQGGEQFSDAGGTVDQGPAPEPQQGGEY